MSGQEKSRNNKISKWPLSLFLIICLAGILHAPAFTIAAELSPKTAAESSAVMTAAANCAAVPIGTPIAGEMTLPGAICYYGYSEAAIVNLRNTQDLDGDGYYERFTFDVNFRNGFNQCVYEVECAHWLKVIDVGLIYLGSVIKSASSNGTSFTATVTDADLAALGFNGRKALQFNAEFGAPDRSAIWVLNNISHPYLPVDLSPPCPTIAGTRIVNMGNLVDCDGNGYYEKFSFDVQVNADLPYGYRTVYATLYCTDQNGSLIQQWPIPSWQISGNAQEWAGMHLDQTNFKGRLSEHKNLYFRFQVFCSGCDTVSRNVDTGPHVPFKAQPPIAQITGASIAVINGRDQDNDGFFDQFNADLRIDAKAGEGSTLTAARVMCKTTGQEWKTGSWSITSTSDASFTLALSHADFGQTLRNLPNPHASLRFAVELWDPGFSCKYDSLDGVAGEPLNVEPTYGVSTPVVTQTAKGPYLSGVDFNNSFKAWVQDWGFGAEPDKIEFRLNGKSDSVPVKPSDVLEGVSKEYNMGRDLRSGPCLTDNTLQIVAYNNKGGASEPVTLNLQCIDPSWWMLAAGPISIPVVHNLTKAATYSTEYSYEWPGFRVDISDDVPFIGGRTGIDALKLTARTSYSGGRMTGRIAGGMTTYCADRSVGWTVGGSGNFCLCPLRLTSSTVDLSGSASLSLKSVKIPVVNIGVSAALKPSASLSCDLVQGDGSCSVQTANDPWELKQIKSPEFGLGVEFAGVVGKNWGLSGSVTGGTVGKIVLQIPGDPNNCCYGNRYIKKANLSVYASLKGCFLGFCREEKYSWQALNCEAGAASAFAAPNTKVTRWDSGWIKNCRGYLDSPDGYMKLASDNAVMEPTTDSGSTLAAEPPLISNIYPYAFPSLACNGNAAVITYCYDRGMPGANQDLQIGAMQYSGLAWSAAPAVTATAYPNVQPSVAYDTLGQPVCVWVGMPTASGNENDPVQLFSRMEIFASCLNSTSWSAAQRLTTNNYLDAMPRVVRGADGVVTALWISQKENSLPIMPDDAVSLSCDLWGANWNGASFGVPYLLASGLPITTTPAFIRLADGTILATFSTDKDSMSNTSADREITLLSYKNGNAVVRDLTSDGFLDDYPRLVALRSGDAVAVWTKIGLPAPGGRADETNDQLWYARVWPTAGDAEKAFDTTFVADLQASLDCVGNLLVFWSGGSPDGSDIHYASFQDSTETWSLPQQLTNDLAPDKMLAVGSLESSVLCAYLKTQASVQDAVETMPDGTTETVNEVVLGNSDLRALTHLPSSDLVISNTDMHVDPSPSPGAVVTLSTDVHCYGDTQKSAAVAFYDGDPAAGGSLIGESTKMIQAGGTSTFSATWTAPSSTTARAIYAKVDPQNLIVEDNESNNTGQLWLFGTDIAVTSPEVVSIVGTRVTLQAQVQNLGQSPVTSLPWTIFAGNDSWGAVLASSTVSLAAGASANISTTFDTASTPGQAANIQVAAYAAPSDPNPLNNVSYGTVDFLPDIAIRDGSASVNDNSVVFTVANEGVRATGTFITRAVSGEQVLGEATMPSIAPGGSSNVTISITQDLLYAGITVVANPGQTILEMRNDNNTTFLAFSNHSRIGLIRGLPDGMKVKITDKPVSASFGGFFYVQEPDRSAGIKVVCPNPPAAGVTATFFGQVATAGAEKIIVAETATAGAVVKVQPIGMRLQNLGGHLTGQSLGFADSAGLGSLYNIGLLTRVAGHIMYTDGSRTFAYLDDGSFLFDGNTVGPDGTGVTGVRVILPNGAGLPRAGLLAVLTGVSSTETLNGKPVRALRLRNQADIIPVYDGRYAGEMIYVPPGSFLMGNSGVGDDNQEYGVDDEKPQHSVYVSGYWIGRHEVTRSEYRAFIDADGYSNPAYWSTEGWSWKRYTGRTQPDWWASNVSFSPDVPLVYFRQEDDYPVVGVSYFEAEAFCNWAGCHLPTEAQWEKAARWTGSHPNIYPWGDAWDVQKCNNWDDNLYQRYQTSPVGRYSIGSSPYGLQDMAGNAAEWCMDWYSNYGPEPPEGWIDPQGPPAPIGWNTWRVIRGGNWSSSPASELRCARRYFLDPAYTTRDIGFRVAR